MSLVIGMCVKSKSVFLFLVKDFEFELFKNLNDRDVLSLNYIWLVYCMLKIISKIVVMITLDFIKLYWLVFWLGEPINILLIVISFAYIKKRVRMEEMINE